MNEEEKQAIEFLKHSIFEYEEIDTSVMEYIDKNHKIIYKLILKQQKEIVELKMQLEVEKIDNKYNQEETHEETIPRFKIKEKIEEITSYAYTSAEERDCQDYAIQVLKELLGE